MLAGGMVRSASNGGTSRTLDVAVNGPEVRLQHIVFRTYFRLKIGMFLHAAMVISASGLVESLFGHNEEAVDAASPPPP